MLKDNIVSFVKNNFSDKLFFTSRSFYERVNSFVKFVTNRYKRAKNYVPIVLRLFWDESDFTACTDNNVLMVNMNTSLLRELSKKDRVTGIFGMVSHELGHILETNFVLFKEFLTDWDYKSFLSDETCDFFTSHKTVSLEILKQIQNIYEDPFVEYAMKLRYKGQLVSKAIDFIVSLLRKGITERLSDGSYDFIGLLLAQARNCLDEKFLEEYPCLVETQVVFDRIYEMPLLTMEERLNNTLVIFDKIFETFIKDEFKDMSDEEMQKQFEQMKENNSSESTSTNSNQHTSGFGSSSQPKTQEEKKDNEGADSSNESCDERSSGNNESNDEAGAEDESSSSGSHGENEQPDSEDEKGSGSSTENDTAENGEQKNEERNNESGSCSSKEDEQSDAEDTRNSGGNTESETCNNDNTNDVNSGSNDDEGEQNDMSSSDSASDESSSSGLDTDNSSSGSEIHNDSSPRANKEINSDKGDELVDCDNEAIELSVDNVIDSVAKSLAKEETVQSEFEKEQIKTEIVNTPFHSNVTFTLEKKTGGSKDIYNSYMSQGLKTVSKQAQNKIRDAVLQKRKSLTQKKQSRGNRVDVAAYARRRKPEDTNVFINSKRANKSPMMSVSVVLDHSDSMTSSDKINYGMFASMIIEDFCRNLKIPFSLITHTASGGHVVLHEYATFGGNKDERYALTKIPNDNMFHRNRDGFAIRYAVNKIKKRKEELKVVFVISDGLPNDSGYGYFEAVQDVADIRKTCKKNNVELLAFAIDGNIEALSNLYGEDNLVDARELDKFPKEISRVLAKKSEKIYKGG